MIDFKKELVKRNVNRSTMAMATVAFVLCIENITQQINIAMHGIETVKDATDSRIAGDFKAALQELGPETFWKVAELCRIHGKNLCSIADILEREAGKPEKDSILKLRGEMYTLSRQYVDDSIFIKYMNELTDALQEAEGTEKR